MNICGIIFIKIAGKLNERNEKDDEIDWLQKIRQLLGQSNNVSFFV